MNITSFFQDLKNHNIDTQYDVPIIFSDFELKSINFPEDTTPDHLSFSDIVFKNFAIQSCSFSNTIFSKVVFQACNLSFNVFNSCSFSDIRWIEGTANKFENSKFSNTYFGLDFLKSNLNKEFFSNCIFKNCSFNGITIEQFENSSFHDCAFLYTEIEISSTEEIGLKFYNCSFPSLKFNTVALKGFEAHNCSLDSVIKLSGVAIESCIFEGLKFELINCSGKNLIFQDCALLFHECSFIDSDFSKSRFGSISDSKIIFCDFFQSKIKSIRKTDVSGSSFYQADLSLSTILDCNLENADFTDIIIDGTFYRSSYKNIIFLQHRSNIPGVKCLTYCLETKLVYLVWEYGFADYEFVTKDQHDKEEKERRERFLKSPDIANKVYFAKKRILTGSPHFEAKYSYATKLKLNSKSDQKATLMMPVQDLTKLVIALFIDGHIFNSEVHFFLPEMNDGSEFDASHFKYIGQQILHSLKYFSQFEIEELHTKRSL